jgi:hypothetical protein
MARNSDDSRLWKGASEPAERFYGRKKRNGAKKNGIASEMISSRATRVQIARLKFAGLWKWATNGERRFL